MPYTIVERVLLLQNVELLSASGTEELSVLASIAEEVEYSEGAVIVEEGQPASALFVIIQGSVQLSRNAQDVIKLGEKEAMGAWTMFEAEPLVMTAVAAQETLLLRVNREDFFDLLLDYPELGQGILKSLVRRLRKLVPTQR